MKSGKEVDADIVKVSNGIDGESEEILRKLTISIELESVITIIEIEFTLG